MAFTRLQLKRRSKKKKFRFFFLFFFLILLFLFFYFFSRLDSLKVKNIFIEGNTTISKKELNSFLKNNINKNFLFFFSKNNIFFLSEKQLAQAVANAFPEIYHARLKIKQRDIYLDVEERKAHSLWCKDADYSNIYNELCYFADQRGYIYARAPYFSDGVFQKIYLPADSIMIGKKVMDENDFQNFFHFIDALKKKTGMQIAKIFMNEPYDIKIFMTSFLGKTFKSPYPWFLFKKGDSYDLLLKEMDILLKQDLFIKNFREKGDELKFIDFRIPHQLRFKFYLTDEQKNSA